MIFSFILILVLIGLDIIAYSTMKKRINKLYKKSIDLINKFNPLSKLEMEQSKNSFLMRMLVLALFWLCINFIYQFEYIIKSTIINLSADFEDPIDTFYEYIKYILIIISCFIYFAINIYSKNNFYIRTYDIISGILLTRFIIFIS